MNQTHLAFLNRPEGQRLSAVIHQPELLRVFEEFVFAEVPPVQALIREIDPILAEMDEKTRRYAAQSCGALVGDILTARGFRVMRGPQGENRRGRIRRSRFIRTGTLFERPPTPSSDPNFDKAMQIARETMVKYRQVFEALAK